MIPKILHFIWFGDLKIPRIIDTWIENHPEWSVKIWTDDDTNNMKLFNKEIFDIKNKKYNQKSDILRLEILYNFGGVYVDCDIFNLKNIDELLDTNLFFIQEKLGLVSNSIIGSVKNNPIIFNIMKRIKSDFDSNIAVWKSSGPAKITEFLVSNSIIDIPQSTINYDIVSRVNNVVIYPYYYINFMLDIIKQNTFTELNIDQIKNIKNRDIKYIKYNRFYDSKIFGIQLWMGGRKSNYKKNLSRDLLFNNITKYLDYITKCN